MSVCINHTLYLLYIYIIVNFYKYRHKLLPDHKDFKAEADTILNEDKEMRLILEQAIQQKLR